MEQEVKKLLIKYELKNIEKKQQKKELKEELNEKKDKYKKNRYLEEQTNILCKEIMLLNDIIRDLQSLFD